MEAHLIRAKARALEAEGDLFEAARLQLFLSDLQQSAPSISGEFNDKGVQIRVPKAQWLSALSREALLEKADA